MRNKSNKNILQIFLICNHPNGVKKLINHANHPAIQLDLSPLIETATGSDLNALQLAAEK